MYMRIELSVVDRLIEKKIFFKEIFIYLPNSLFFTESSIDFRKRMIYKHNILTLVDTRSGGSLQSRSICIDSGNKKNSIR